MIIENSLGQKINNPENFWKWFGNSVTVDEQGRPRVFYHGTRQKFDSFKSKYRDKLAFFSYDEKFAKDWARNARIQDDQKQAYEEIEDKIYAYGKEIYKRFKEKYGENWLENEDLKDQYYKEKEEYKEQLLKEINLEKKVLGCYLKVSKLFIPERDSDLVLDEIIKYYQWEDKWGLDDKIKVASANFQKVNNEFDEWWKNNKNATEEEKKEQNKKLDTAYQAMFSLKNEKAQFDNDLKRIKQGAWIYFEHGNVIDKIYELGYDGIQLSEAGGEQTTIAVRTGRNQIKSVDNKGGYDASENIYESLNKELRKYIVYHGSQENINEDYYEQFENLHEINHTTILQEFEMRRSDKIEWEVIPAKQYYNALKQYDRDGKFFKFPERIIQEWLDLVCKNSIRFELLNDFWNLYDGELYALYAVEIIYTDGESLTCEQAVKILEDEGFYDWARLPDGSEGYSDQKTYVDILMELDEFPTKEEMLVAINRCIDVWHQRGDMAAMLIEGGKETARKISLGTFNESFSLYESLNRRLERYL